MMHYIYKYGVLYTCERFREKERERESADKQNSCIMDSSAARHIKTGAKPFGSKPPPPRAEIRTPTICIVSIYIYIKDHTRRYRFIIQMCVCVCLPCHFCVDVARRINRLRDRNEGKKITAMTTIQSTAAAEMYSGRKFAVIHFAHDRHKGPPPPPREEKNPSIYNTQRNKKKINK